MTRWLPLGALCCSLSCAADASLAGAVVAVTPSGVPAGTTLHVTLLIGGAVAATQDAPAGQAEVDVALAADPQATVVVQVAALDCHRCSRAQALGELAVNGAGRYPLSVPLALLQNPLCTAGPLLSPRSQHDAVLLTSGPQSGQVLVVGGQGAPDSSGGATYPAQAETYDPLSGTSSPAFSLTVARAALRATALNDPAGRVLITGGYNGAYQASAELYDPAQGSLSALALLHARGGHTATLLQDGRVLIAGGDDGQGGPLEAEIFDPATASFSPAGTLSTQRVAAAATLLDSGQVLVSGGLGPLGDAQGDADLFDPAQPAGAQWSLAGALIVPRARHAAVLLPGGVVLIAGGWGPAGALASVELYQPATARFLPQPALPAGREGLTATPLRGALALLAGGDGDPGGAVADTALFDGLSGAYVAVASLRQARTQHTATALADDGVVLLGGVGPSPAQGPAPLVPAAELLYPTGAAGCPGP